MLFVLVLLLALMLYAQVGYPALMAVLARLKPKALAGTNPAPSGISLVLCVHNGAVRIQERLRNLAGCEWDGDREIIVYCDGCTDDTAVLAASAGVAGVRVLTHPEKRGKWAALNDAVAACTYPVIVFADLRQTFERAALQRLAAPFADPAVGAVSGLLEIASSDAGSGRGVDLYWKIERKLREWEARYDSVIGCTGAIYAIRREAFRTLPAGTILDDVVVPMQIAVQGLRVWYEPQAIAFDPQTLDPHLEKQRKLRTLCGNYQLIEWFPGWLVPGRNRLWWQLISHKYLRLAVPWLMVAILLLTLAAPKSPLIWLLLMGQIAAYAAAGIGLLLPGCRSRLLSIPAGFLLLQWACLKALFAYLRCRRDPLALWR